MTSPSHKILVVESDPILEESGRNKQNLRETLKEQTGQMHQALAETDNRVGLILHVSNITADL